MDLYETEDAFILEADLPGVKSGDVKMKIVGRDLVLRGWRSLEQQDPEGQSLEMEHSSGYFVRCIRLVEASIKMRSPASIRTGYCGSCFPNLTVPA